MAIISNLYPPIMPDALPAFDRTGECRIYFSLSKYNSKSDIKSIQISFVNLRTNASALKPDLYPSGIKVTNAFNEVNDSTAQGDYRYYVTVYPDDLINNIFELNQFYKIQLRFSKQVAPSAGKELAEWIYQNRSSFSEWSKVCLIKGIDKPIISIHGFNSTEDNQETILTDPLVDIVGELTYEDSGETEYLKSYNIKISQTENENVILFDSGEIVTNSYNPNEFNYQIAYEFLDGTNYTMIFTYTTNNMYSATLKYHFTIVQSNIVEGLNADITAAADSENGRIKISLTAKDSTQEFIGNFTIRRTSSESNFHIWEDVKTDFYEERAVLNYSWYDATVKSGVWYKYCAQRRNSNGDRSAIIQIQKPVMCIFDDIFLSAEGRQLKIKLNPSLNEFKYNVSQSQQVAIGSKFPFIKRNGANYFRTFPLGGLISSFMDTSNWFDPHFYEGQFHPNKNEIKAFSSKKEIYQDAQDYYNDYNNQNNISEYDDYVYEREFREQVYAFLYKHNVKLFRSTTEGNILIKLMNIDFQPIQSLGRRLYSFTATAVEVDQATTANYDKYNIQSIGTYQNLILYEHTVFGQISGDFSATDGNLLQSKISSKYEKSTNSGFINKVNDLKSIKLDIESDPYLIIEQNNFLIQASASSTADLSKAVIGYIVIINGVQMIIKANPVRYAVNDSITTQTTFELNGDNVIIKDLQFKYPTKATINYVASLEQVEDTSYLVSQVHYYKKPGQLYGTFSPEEHLINKIYNKYILNYSTYYQRLLDVTGIRIEGNPGTIVYIKDSKDSDFNRHILENGFLQLEDPQAFINDLYFYGIHLVQSPNSAKIKQAHAAGDIFSVRQNEYVLMDGSYNSLQDITSPLQNGVYQVASDKYIYYKNHWYTFTQEYDVLCPVDCIVDYYCEVIKGVYKKNGI